jgi:hypothetical protein
VDLLYVLMKLVAGDAHTAVYVVLYFEAGECNDVVLRRS